MNIEKILELQKSYGDEVVWEDDGKWNITFADSVMDDLDREYEDRENVRWWIAYGDDCPNAIELSDIENLDGEIENFIYTHVGRSCYN